MKRLILALLATPTFAADQPGLLKSEFIYESAPFPSCHATTIVETKSGLTAAWFGGTAEGKPDVAIWSARLMDDRWTAPVEVANGVQSDGTRHPCWNPVLFQPKTGPLLLFYKVGPSPSKWWGMLRTSTDSGRTWSEARRLPDGILGPIKNKPVQLANGDILCPTSSEHAGWRVHFERTSDGGATWSRTEAVNDGKSIGAIQPSILFIGGEKLLAVGRTKQAHIFRVASDDGGKTWGEMSLTDLPNPNSGIDAVTLRDGRHLLVYNHTVKGRSPLNLAVSRDGQAWEAALVLESEPGEYSYPAIIQTSDGLVHITYTWKRQKVRHVVVDPAKLKPQAMTSGGWPRAASTGIITNSLGMKLAQIPAGSFLMGQDGPAADYNVKKHAGKFDDADWDERPAHRVTISAPFAIGTTEVTLAQYRQFQPKHSGDRGAADDAVADVSWNDAVKFCEWLSAKEKRTYRLPTEAEWEYACRAGTTTLFHTGDALPAGFHKWFADIGLRDRFFPDGKLPPEFRVDAKSSVRVAQTPANAWGLFDMHGNVAEWCADWYGPYDAAEQTDPLGRRDGDFRVIRGGGHSMQTRLLRSANRSGWLPESSNEKTGFRVVLGEVPHGRMLPPAAPALNAQNVDQTIAKIQAPSADVPFFSGPKPFVIIPPDSAGPLFSWHNHSPAIAECPNGDLLAVWYSCVDEAGTELNNLASRLRRGATEWEPASLFWDGADVNDHAPKLWWDGERTLFHFARGQSENIVRTSTDNGATWSKARAIQPQGEFGNAPIKTREGFMVITQDVTITSLNISRDGGQTWTFPAITDKANAHRSGSSSRHAGIHAPIVQLADGRLMTIGRLNTAAEQEKFGFKTPASFSRDWGATWTHAATEFPAISSVQRAVLMRLREGPLLLCSFTDQRANWKDRKGLPFPAAGGKEYTGCGLFAAVSFDDGKTWPVRKLITPGGPERTLPSIDRGMFTLSGTMAESGGYLAATQTRDGNIQLISSKNHYDFNLAWLKQLPPAP